MQNIKKGSYEQLVTTQITDSVNCGCIFIYCSRVIFAAYNKKLNNRVRVGLLSTDIYVKPFIKCSQHDCCIIYLTYSQIVIYYSFNGSILPLLID